MTEPNKRKYRYMKDKHKYFLEQIGLCSTAQPLEIDRKIPGSNMTIRSLLLDIRDKSDNHKVFHSIDLRWNSTSVYNVTYRPDKKSVAYSFCNSLSTYVHNKFPEADLSRLFTMDAIDKAHKESYNDTNQTFVTQEDLAMQMELNNDNDDDSIEWGDFSLVRPLDDNDSEATPMIEPRNQKLFDLSGETESVSTMGNSVTPVTFLEETDVDDTSIHSTTSTKTETSTKSQRARIGTLEIESKSTSEAVDALRGEMSSFMSLISKNIGQEPVAPAEKEQQATGDP